MSVVRSYFRAAAVALALCLLLTACAPAEAPRLLDRQFPAMDTFMSLSTWGEHAGTALDAAQREIGRLEGLLSVTERSSDLARLNTGRSDTVSDDTAELIAFALDMAKRTGGAVDPTVYPAVRAWGFTAQAYRVPTQAELDALLPLIGWQSVSLDGKTVRLPAGTQLDLGSVAKGWAGDRILALWRELGVTGGILRLGGNVQTLGSKPDGSPWVVGVRDPDGGGVLATLSVRDLAVVTSGSYERFFERDGQLYHHIIDPSTGRPADSGLVSVTVVGESGAFCDALSTALFVMGVQRASEFWRAGRDFDAVFIGTDGRVTITEGLRDSFKLTGEFSEREVQVIS